MVFNKSKPCLEYYVEISKYPINNYWNPRAGHSALKYRDLKYGTPTTTIVGFNEFDLVFVDKIALRQEYMWLPTINDLIQLYIDLETDKAGEYVKITGDEENRKLVFFGWETSYLKKSNSILKRALCLDGSSPEINMLRLLHQDDLLPLRREKDSNKDLFLEVVNVMDPDEEPVELRYAKKEYMRVGAIKELILRSTVEVMPDELGNVAEG